MVESPLVDGQPDDSQPADGQHTPAGPAPGLRAGHPVTHPVTGGAPEWAPEHLVTVGQAAGLVGGQFPALRAAAVESLAEGWDNSVFLVGGEWVFRFPRRAAALPGLRREIAVLPRIGPRLPLPVPVPRFLGVPAAGYPWPFWGARLLPGHELAEAGLAEAGRGPAAARTGEFLRALHDPGLADVAGPGLLADPLRRGYPAVRVPMARERLARLERAGVWEGGPAIRGFLAEAERLGPPAGPLVLVHGDLHVRHLLVDDAGRAAGVIDWGDVCLADPAVDLSLAFGGFAGPARAALLAAYGPVSAECATRARALAVFMCAALADYAFADGRPVLLRESLAGLARAVAG
jgi:aminoglycoside phosphotransferase (APT) family kinase protein